MRNNKKEKDFIEIGEYINISFEDLAREINQQLTEKEIANLFWEIGDGGDWSIEFTYLKKFLKNYIDDMGDMIDDEKEKNIVQKMISLLNEINNGTN